MALHTGLLASHLSAGSSSGLGAAAASNRGSPAAAPASVAVLSTATSLKENLGASFNQAAATSAVPKRPGTSGADGGRGAFAGRDAGQQPDALLAQASHAFLSQVEEMRRQHTAEVEALQAEVAQLSGRRDALAAEAASAGASAKALGAKVEAARRQLDEVTRDLGRAQARLASLEEARRAEQQRFEYERAAGAAALERESAAARQALAAERAAAEAAAREAATAAERQSAALEARAARIEKQARGLVDRDAALQQRELEFEGQASARSVQP